MGRHPHACVPVGASEIGLLCEVEHGTVQTWWARTRRGEMPDPMPDPIGTVSGRPAWCWTMVAAWARRTNRPVVEERLQEQIVHGRYATRGGPP
jgi:hypothetical protein